LVPYRQGTQGSQHDDMDELYTEQMSLIQTMWYVTWRNYVTIRTKLKSDVTNAELRRAFVALRELVESTKLFYLVINKLKLDRQQRSKRPRQDGMVKLE
jgi:hypothetical protein